MLNSNRFEEAKTVWRSRKGISERGYKFKLKEWEAFGALMAKRKYTLTYWTKADEWTGSTVDVDGKREPLNERECMSTAVRFGLIV